MCLWKQIEGSDTIDALTYSVVHQIAIIDRLHFRIIDTVGVYLYQTYLSSLPAIFTKPVKVIEACNLYLLNREISLQYGLPNSGRAYDQAFSKLLVDSGYTKNKSDPCLFLKFEQRKESSKSAIDDPMDPSDYLLYISKER